MSKTATVDDRLVHDIFFTMGDGRDRASFRHYLKANGYPLLKMVEMGVSDLVRERPELFNSWLAARRMGLVK
jgi:hypothetical protein